VAGAAFFDFQISEILLADGVWGAQTHNCTKLGQNRSFRCGDLRFFEFSRWPSPPSWIFEIAKFYWLLGPEGRDASLCQILSKSVLRFFDFSRWRPSTTLDSFVAYLDHPQWVLMGLYHSAKFGYYRCSSFCNMNISIFDAFVWKMPIHAPKIGVFEQFDLQNGVQCQRKPKRHTLAWVRAIWAIKRENMVNGLTCRWVDYKSI